MVARITSATLVGVDARKVTVEVDLVRRLPCVQTVGLPARAVRESEDRVRSAVTASGYEFPHKRVVINLAPADLPKSGTGFDLPIALGILRADGQIAGARLERFLMLGELALDGALRPVPGVLAACLAARAAGCDGVVVPRANAHEADLVDGLAVCAAADLGEVARSLADGAELPSMPRTGRVVKFPEQAPPDLAQVRGLHAARRALEVAAAGGHNLLLLGPPGTGKSMMARRLPTVLPPLTRDEALEVTRIHSVGGLLDAARGLISERPFRAPHHSITAQALAGGGVPVRPGEITLAHRGVLYLDELPEFQRGVLESMRQPLEDRVVTIARAAQRVTFPCDVQLVATANPCPCGFLGDAYRACRCSPPQVDRYQARMSGPLLDRIDVFAFVPRTEYAALAADGGESSDAVRQRVRAARERQLRRLADRPGGLRVNARMNRSDLERYCRLPRAARRLMREAVDGGLLSPRAHDRVLRLVRTLADLAGRDHITDEDVSDAIGLRTDAHPQEREAI